jgi:hypothetical protein
LLVRQLAVAVNEALHLAEVMLVHVSEPRRWLRFARSAEALCRLNAPHHCESIRAALISDAAAVSVQDRRRGYVLFGALPPGFRNLTPAPPPFSSMNSTPARVKTSFISVSVAGSPA